MYSIQNISVSFSGNDIFNDANFLINDRDRIGLIGKNGAGKTTLLKIIIGMMEPTSGNVVIPKDKRVGYLPQEMKIVDSTTIIGETMTAFKEKHDVENEIAEINDFLTESTDYESGEYQRKINKLHQLTDHLNIIGGGSEEGEAEKVLMGLGFERSVFANPTSSLSGGWRMRVELAKIILRRPDLLLLDEPTNHLDIESIRWLETFLSNYPGAIVLISHDRTFLDKVTNRTIEISLGKIRDYRTNYSNYIIQREEELELNESSYENQQKQIKDIEAFIEKFRYKATKAKQVQSRIKLLDKMDKIELEQTDNSAMRFKFPLAPPSGKVVLEIEDFGKSYGENRVLENVDLVVLNGEFLAFVGKNGEGKSTLVKAIIGQIEHQGSIKRGYNVELGYYSQNQTDTLDMEKTVFQEIDDVAVGEIRKNIKGILGSFLFRDDDLDKKVKVLSGGEKARLSLAKLMLKPINLLILDEPTNHLDMVSKDILKNALLQFKGTMIVVSHDRDFLSGLSDKTYEFKNRKLKEYIGDIEYFLEKRDLEDLKLLEEANKLVKDKQKEISENKVNYLQKKELEKERRRVTRQIEKCEESITELEEKIAAYDIKLANPEKYNLDFSNPETFAKYNDLKAKLEKTMEDWEILHAELEDIELQS